MRNSISVEIYKEYLNLMIKYTRVYFADIENKKTFKISNRSIHNDSSSRNFTGVMQLRLLIAKYPIKLQGEKIWIEFEW